MAFNREDLITWNELAPSLQTIFKTLQEEVNDSSIKSLKIAALLDEKMDAEQVDQMIRTYIADEIIPTLPTTAQLYELNDAISDLTTQFNYHLDDTNPHPGTGSYFMIHQTKHDYDEGQWVHTEELPNNLVLECVKAGTSGTTKPSFDDE